MRLLRLLCAVLFVAAGSQAAQADERPLCLPLDSGAACVAQAPTRAIDLHDRRQVAEALRQGIWLAGVQPPAGPVSPAALEAYLARIFWTGPSS
jgi:Fe-S-cluster-containing hydrogenase component 2